MGPQRSRRASRRAGRAPGGKELSVGEARPARHPPHAGPAGLSAALLDHYRQPRNPGSLARAADVGTGEAGEPEAGARVRLQLRIDAEGRVAEARFKAFGCSATIACASYVTERVSGRPVSEAAALGRDQIARALALPPDRLRAAALAERALRGALAELRGRLPL